MEKKIVKVATIAALGCTNIYLIVHNRWFVFVDSLVYEWKYKERYKCR